MNKLKYFRFLLVFIIAPFFYIGGIYGYLIKHTNSVSNNFTIGQMPDYVVTFEYNNGDAQTTRPVVPGNEVGTLPSLVSYDDCVLPTGNSYYERQCTYAYKFEGWFTESNFVNQVNANYIPTGNVTLYAKWNKIFYGHSGTETFTGSNLINTGVKLFSEANAHKNFIVTFVVETNNGYNSSSGDRGTIFTDMNESGEPYTGVNFFTTGNTSYTMNINILGNKVKDTTTGYVTGQRVVIKKENGIVYYSYDNGPFITINDFTNFSAYFDNNATFGGGTNSQNKAYRYFKGVLSDMSVEVFDTNTYTVHYDANGGSGMMIDQSAVTGQTFNLRGNSFTHVNKSFAGWNTQADGSGTSYTNGQSVSNLTTPGNVITLYAQWMEVITYYVHFDANGGTGTMNDQQFTYSSNPVALTTNAFTKTGYMFMGWNTAADGSGTSYKDGEQVRDLSNVQNDVITLYAQYMWIAYQHPGEASFDGTSLTFIDTGVNLYSQANYSKDFEIRFTVTEASSLMFTDPNHKQLTVFNCKDESNPKYPGFNLRFNNSPTTMAVGYKWKNNTSGSTTIANLSTNHLPIHFVYKRVNGVVSVQYSYSGFDSGEVVMFDQVSWQLDVYFPDNISFGGIYNSTHDPDRFFIGKTSDMYILIDD